MRTFGFTAPASPAVTRCKDSAASTVRGPKERGARQMPWGGWRRDLGWEGLLLGWGVHQASAGDLGVGLLVAPGLARGHLLLRPFLALLHPVLPGSLADGAGGEGRLLAQAPQRGAVVVLGTAGIWEN